MSKLKLAARREHATEKLAELHRRAESLEEREKTVLIALLEAQESSILHDIHNPHAAPSGELHPEQIEGDLIIDLEKIKEESASVRRNISEITNSIANVSALPDNILCDIFALGMDFLSGIHVEIRPRFIFTASHVIRHWRSVAINSPALWTAIDIWPWQSEEVVRTHLQHSRSCPLDITFTFVDLGAFFVSRYHSILIPHIHRWRSLLVISDFKGVLDKTLTPFSAMHAPCLEYLEFHCGAVESQNVDSTALFSCGTSPSLSLYVSGISPLRWLPPLASLAHLRIDDQSITVPDFRQLLAETSRLTTLSLFAVHLIHTDITIEPIHVPDLKAVTICGSQEEIYLPTLLTIIIATSLESLILHSFVGHASDFVACLGFHPSVQTLTLAFISLNEESAPFIFHSFPSIKDVILENCMADHILRHLQDAAHGDDTAPDAVSLPWPDIRTLTVTAVDVEVVCKTINTRGTIVKLSLDDAMLDSLTPTQEEILRERVEVEWICYHH